MSHEKLVDKTPIAERILTASLEPKVGKIKIDQHRPARNAVYLEDKEGRIIAYITFRPYWGDVKTMEIESFTNESARRQGVQNRLNQELLGILQEKGVEAIVVQIQIDNTPSLLSRTSVKSLDGTGVLKAEAMNTRQVDEMIRRGQKVPPFALELKVSLKEVVPNNNDVLQKIRVIQSSLT